MEKDMISTSMARPVKRRIVVQKGKDYIPVDLFDVGLIYIQNRVIFLLDKEGKKQVIARSLNEIYEQLDKTLFFRANRNVIINIRFIQSFKTYERVRIAVKLTLEAPFPIIVSQDNAADFRKWICEG